MNKKRGKKAQFYIIAAVIIIVIIIGLATISNTAYVKKEPRKLYDMTDILSQEGISLVNNAELANKSAAENIEFYLDSFSNYLNENTQEDFNLIIIYGSITSGNITGRVYSRSSLGDIRINLGSSSFIVEGGTEINMSETTIKVDSSGSERTVNVTISSIDDPSVYITQTLPILEDNNFVWVMSTSESYSQYVKTNSPRRGKDKDGN